MPEEHPVNPIQSHDLARLADAERLAQSHQSRVREAAHQARQPAESIGRPPDPRRVDAPPANHAGVLVAR